MGLGLHMSDRHSLLPLTIEMQLADPPVFPTDVEEMLIEQRGCREVLIFFLFKLKINLGTFSWYG